MDAVVFEDSDETPEVRIQERQLAEVDIYLTRPCFDEVVFLVKERSSDMHYEKHGYGQFTR